MSIRSSGAEREDGDAVVVPRVNGTELRRRLDGQVPGAHEELERLYAGNVERQIRFELAEAEKLEAMATTFMEMARTRRMYAQELEELLMEYFGDGPT